ncbi:hypothetical protein BOX15_Mlig002309g1 [Macrostomum lignano]|uniref:Complexin n=2 Tax=Macrostomum lignano TaxID=282301 RepID=A0A1I8I1C4_9PLAT|nr:hypothetical protein BOX15_Mlig002309g3 [Macrostomum lignano]PAA48632.1 hypothetical protein BOX15_Mlig002309g2 [Macrostomum lignano]PAA84532.1 hypothetical protein BOX15_Mlig002309g1 [Macrostomum lignano]
MAGFIAKQLVGKQMDSVKKMGGEEANPEDTEKQAEEAAAIAEALAEEKRKRDEKHQKMEAEREELRQGIRDKYNIQKKEEEFNFGEMDDGKGVGRKRKTPEELAAERDLEEKEDFASFLPEGVRDTVRNVTAVPQKMISDAQEKCVIQ